MGNQTAGEMTTGFEEKTDRELVEACLAHSNSAWECLIVRYERLIYSIPIRLGMSSQEAADIFQSVCFIMFKKLKTLRDHERISSWLITTTRRECWRVGSLKHREVEITEASESNGLRDSSEIVTAEQLAFERRVADEQKQIVRNGVSSLPERCRELLTMLFYLNEEMSYEDIAERMKIPESSIGPTRARCLEKLKKALHGKF
jgi:RNA polymerase sigma factor (sigma-70 family)